MQFLKSKSINYISAVIIIILIIIICFFLLSSSKEDQLQTKISISLRSGNNVNEDEWNQLVNIVLEDKKTFGKYVSNDTINVKALNHYINEIASKRRKSEPPHIFNTLLSTNVKNKDIKQKNTSINVFIENSGSMDGYVKNTTEFEAALADLLVQTQYQYSKNSIKINFINSKIFPLEVNEINEFVSNLNPLKTPYNMGNRGESKLNEVLTNILDNTNKNDVSIFLSDCIYSLEANKDTDGGLEFQKNLTKGAFLEKSKQFNLSTIILKMNSRFDGKYWDKNNKFQKLQNSTRPYYIWIMGRNDLIKEFSNKINFSSLKGFQNSFSLKTSKDDNSIFYTILRETNKIGRFKQSDRSAKIINSITDIDYQNGEFQFSILVDLSGISVDSVYLVNSENYSVTNGFTIKTIEKVSDKKITPRDMVTVKNTTGTHLITVSVNENEPLKNLEIELINKIPNWVKQSNTFDDTNINTKLDKTFGLLHLIEGVSEAYQIQNNNQLTPYYKINIKIK